MTYEELRSKYKSIKPCFRVNKFDLPLNIFPQTEAGVDEFNEVVDLIHSLPLDDMKTPVTKSGGISIAGGWDYVDTYRITASKSSIEIILLYDDFYRFEFRREFKKDKTEVSGKRAFHKFTEICKKYGIDINDYRLSTEDGLKAKSEIPSPINEIADDVSNIVIYNAHHLDIHSAHMSGVAEAFPELYSPINECYKRRKENEIFKSVMTHSWGYMQSANSPVYYQLSHLSKAGMQGTNRKIRDLERRLIESGREILLINTDGIWYAGDIYHGDGEGKELGQWENDHINCKFRAKSQGVYEFIDDAGVYHVSAKGNFQLDKVKPRDQWVWGDIYCKGNLLQWQYDEVTEHLSKIERYDL